MDFPPCRQISGRARAVPPFGHRLAAPMTHPGRLRDPNHLAKSIIDIATHYPNVARGPVSRYGRDQKLRRFLLRLTGCCRIDRDWKSPQINAPAKTTNTDTTAAETRIESTGIATSFEFRGSMPDCEMQSLTRIKLWRQVESAASERITPPPRLPPASRPADERFQA
jgi:hypothetical protein